ncbi:MAG: methyltransferase [Hyphomicrobiales bacterium]|nr:methyltransferase [Hyphomicrobiales bacterium]
MTSCDETCDAWLGGQLTLVQLKHGHRFGSDAALLAAAIDMSEGRVVDVGAGVGAVGLALAHRSAGLAVDLVEIDPGLAKLAAENAMRNRLAERARALALDIGDPRARRAAGLADDGADAVLTNPPFLDPAQSRVSPAPARARARAFEAGERAPLDAWIRGCVAILRPGGRFVMIHRTDALGAILAAAENRLGSLALLPVYPRVGAAAHRLLVSGVKGSRAPLRVAPGLVLHRSDGRFTIEADAIHRGERLIDWGT